MCPEQLQNFHERLNQWIAKQGFWVQFRYSLMGGGMWGSVAFCLLRRAFRLVIVAVILAVAGWGILERRAFTKNFQDEIRVDLQAGLSAETLTITQPKRKLGILELSNLEAEGTKESFFASLVAKNIRCEMGLLDGITAGPWRAGVISMDELEMHLRAGAEDEESAHKLVEVLFRKPQKLDARAFEIRSATLHWGLSEQTQGSIEQSNLKIERTEAGWKLHFKGGRFSQNWLHQLEIVNLVALFEPNGILFETAELRQGDATIDFAGLKVKAGANPDLAGELKVRNLSLEKMLSSELNDLLEGSISGTFKVFGSTNLADGVGYEGKVELGEKDMISLREKIYLLKALSAADSAHNYHQLDFRKGSFRMRTSRGGMQIFELALQEKADEPGENQFTLEGELNAFLPTQKEMNAAKVKEKSIVIDSPILNGEEPEGISENSSDASPASLETVGKNKGAQSWQNQKTVRISRIMRYHGTLKLTIPGNAFEGSDRLRQEYPAVGAKTPVSVPIEGYLYELSLKQAEEIYQSRKN